MWRVYQTSNELIILNLFYKAYFLEGIIEMYHMFYIACFVQIVTYRALLKPEETSKTKFKEHQVCLKYANKKNKI